MSRRTGGKTMTARSRFPLQSNGAWASTASILGSSRPKSIVSFGLVRTCIPQDIPIVPMKRIGTGKSWPPIFSKAPRPKSLRVGWIVRFLSCRERAAEENLRRSAVRNSAISQQRRHGARAAVLVDGDEGESGDGHLLARVGAESPRPGLDMDFHRGPAYFLDFV